MPINIDHRQNIIVTDDGLLKFEMISSVRLPAGTTGRRPGKPVTCIIRFNTSLPEPQYVNTEEQGYA